MATYPAIDGIPVHSSDYILTTILRDELGFEDLSLLDRHMQRASCEDIRLNGSFEVTTPNKIRSP